MNSIGFCHRSLTSTSYQDQLLSDQRRLVSVLLIPALGSILARSASQLTYLIHLLFPSHQRVSFYLKLTVAASSASAPDRTWPLRVISERPHMEVIYSAFFTTILYIHIFMHTSCTIQVPGTTTAATCCSVSSRAGSDSSQSRSPSATRVCARSLFPMLGIGMHMEILYPPLVLKP